MQDADAGRGPLAGLRVLELGSEIALPYATRLLADAGADVIKLEAPSGDPLRRWRAGGLLPAGRDGALFRYLAAGKRSVVVDLDSDAGRARLRELAHEADLLFEDLGPGARGLVARGLDCESLRRDNPRLSLISLSPWGLEGPWAERPATEFTLQAASGSLAYRGLPARGPVGAGGRLGEWVSAPYVALGGLGAWLSARRTGRGQQVDVSMFECVIACMTLFHDLQSQFFPGPLPQSIETPSIEPAKDGWVGFATYTGQQWKDFCLMIERPELALDERFFDGRARMEHLPFIHAAIHAFTRRHTVDELTLLATALRIPTAPIGDGRRVLDFEQFRARGVFVASADGEFRQPRVPYRIEAFEPAPPRAAPRLGEHTASARFAGVRLPVGSGGEPLPLAGVRIVDLTAFLAGPLATSLLADLGADVIKVESIQRPDGMRFAGALRNETIWEWSPIFHGANPGKRAVTLNLDRPEGRELLLQLVDGADALLENFSVRVLDHFGLDAQTLRARNPRLVLLRMPAWGLDGPWRDRVGFAPSVEQASGLAWLTGYPDLPLVVRGACDPLGGMHAAFALLLALEQRARTGVAPHVEVPLCEPALCAAAEQVIEWTAYGELLERTGNRGPYAAPQGVYRCAPGEGERACEWLALAVATDAQWQGLRRALGDPAALRDAQLASAPGRRAAHDAIDAQLATWCAARSCAQAEASLLAQGVPAAQCTNAHFLRPNPQLEARDFFGLLEHGLAGKLRHPEIPMHFRALGRHLHRRGPPTLGQHNAEVLRELGVGEAELEALRKEKVIGERPSFL